MDKIVYEEEEVREEIFEGTFILDGLRMTKEQQEEKIKDMMRIAGVEFSDDEDLIISFEGADDDYGISETQTSKFVVSRKAIKKVPYKLEETKILVDEGLISTYNRSSVDGRVLTPEEYVKEMLQKENPGLNIDNITVKIGSANDAIEKDKNVTDYYDDDQVAYFHAYYVTTTKVPLTEEERKELENKNVDTVKEEKIADTDKVNNVQDKEELKKYLDELKKVREQVNSIDNLEERNKIIEEAVKRVENVNKNITSSNSRSDNTMFKVELEEIDTTIKKLQEEQSKIRREYQKSQREMTKIIDKQNEKMNDNLTDEEQMNLLEEFGKMKLEVNQTSIELKEMLDKQSAMLRTLNNNKKKLTNLVELLSDLNVSSEEYNNINGFLKKRNIVNGILRKKGLSEILDKPAKERTKEEQAEIRKAKDEIKTELAKYISENNETDILNAVQVLYSIDETYKEEKEPRPIETTEEKINSIKVNANYLPARIVGDFPKEFVYKPGKAPEDMLSYELKEIDGFNIDPSSMNVEDEFRRVMGFDFDPDKYEIKPGEGVRDNDNQQDGYNSGEYDDGPYERYTIYEKVPKEKENSEEKEVEKKIEYDVKRIKAFNIDPTSMNDEDEFRRVMGFDFDPDKYEIRPDDGVRDSEDEDDYNSGEYDDGPYERHVIYEKVPVEEKEPVESEEEKDETPEETEETNSVDLSNDVEEKITLFVDQNDDVYIRKAAFERFKDRILGQATDRVLFENLGEPVRINGALCYKIDEEDADYIFELSNNPVSPYMVDTVSVQVDEAVDTITDGDEDEDEEEKDDTNKSSVVVGGDDDDDDDDDDDNDDDDNEDEDEDEDTNDSSVVVGGDDDSNDGDDDEDKDEDEDTEDISINRNNDEPVRGRPHYHAILDKLTSGLDIHNKDAARYKASNIKVTKAFKDELHSGNYLYNIVHVGIAVLKFPFRLVSKGVSALRLGIRGKKAMEEVKKRLDDLSDEELEVLFNEYKGSALKTDMDTYIGPLVLDKVREYGLKKVEVLNNKIKDNYTKLFVLLGELKSLEKRIVKAPKKEAKALYEIRKKLYEKAAECVNNIEEDRIEANNLLSSGVHGLEEDYKAVSTKMSYVGKRFIKNPKKFDNELKHKEGKYGQGLRDAQANNDSEKIVENFMGLESCYYDNTKVSRSIFGNRSVGSRYFTPVAEQFDYRNDPFINDLLTTIVLATSAVSAVNAVRTNIANTKAIREHQHEINQVNQANNATMRDVHQVGNNITAKGDSYMEGMKAGVHQDSLNVATTAERGAMDKTDWGFGDYYRELDSANHDMYNNLYDTATGQLNDIAKSYTDGTISQIDALKEMASVQATTQRGLVDVVNDIKGACTTYAENHPQFDLHSMLESFDYISAHPNAVTEMAASGIASIEEAAKLAGMSVEQAKAFSNLSDDTLTTILNAGAAAGLAGKVVRDMSNNAKRGKYKDARTAEIEDMFAEYYGEAEENNRKSR